MQQARVEPPRSLHSDIVLMLSEIALPVHVNGFLGFINPNPQAYWQSAEHVEHGEWQLRKRHLHSSAE